MKLIQSIIIGINAPCLILILFCDLLSISKTITDISFSILRVFIVYDNYNSECNDHSLSSRHTIQKKELITFLDLDHRYDFRLYQGCNQPHP